MPAQSKSNGMLLVVIIALVGIALAGSVYVFATSLSKTSVATPTPDVTSQPISVPTTYQNPVDKQTQYTNPFSDDQKNPFDAVK